MITSINSSDSKKTMIKTAIGTAAGAGIGAGTAYLLQSRAIKKEKEAQAAAQELKGFKGMLIKSWTKIKGWINTAKTKLDDSLKTIAKEGKVSKMGIAKTAGVGALVVGSLTLLKAALANKKED